RVETVAPGGFTGRQATRYAYSDASQPSRSGKALIGMIGGDAHGTPLISATERGGRGRDSVSRLALATGDVSIALGQENSPRRLADGNGKATVTDPAGMVSDYRFDGHGRHTVILC